MSAPADRITGPAPSGPLAGGGGIGPDMAIGVDVGGTKVAAGLVDADGRVLSQLRRRTPADDVDALTVLVAEAVRELRTAAGAGVWTAAGMSAGVGALPVGVGAAGMVDLDGVIRFAPNIDWRDYPLRAQLETALGEPVLVENDANVAAWGEYRVGAGRAARSSLVMLTVGTGVGGGLVLGDRLIRGASGVGAEFGHIVLSEGGPACNCGNHGDLESLASGTAIGRMAREALAAGDVPPGSPLAAGAPGAGGAPGPGGGLTGRLVTQAAEAGDPVAAGILGRAGFWLGVGIASLVNALDPEIVVLGGGAMEAAAFLLPAARAAAAERIMGAAHRRVPPIVVAELGGEAGLVGAALLARDAAARPVGA